MKFSTYLKVLLALFAIAAFKYGHVFWANTMATGGRNLMVLAAVVAVPFVLYKMMDPNDPKAIIQDRTLRPDEKLQIGPDPISVADVNPATGLQMNGGLDSAGNAFGSDGSCGYKFMD